MVENTENYQVTVCLISAKDQLSAEGKEKRL
jgi:hypothetical protein